MQIDNLQPELQGGIMGVEVILFEWLNNEIYLLVVDYLSLTKLFLKGRSFQKSKNARTTSIFEVLAARLALYLHLQSQYTFLNSAL